MKMKYVALTMSVVLSVGAAVAFSSSVNFDEPAMNYSESSVEATCGGVAVNSQKVDVEVNETEVTVSGLYCANTGGYTVVEQSLSSTEDEIEAFIEIEGPGEDQAVITAITPVEFSVTEEFEPGSYELAYEVEMDDETLETGVEDVEIQGDEPVEESTLFSSFVNWLTGLF